MADKRKEGDSFESNFRKLEALAQELQENKISLDDLVPRMKEALESIRVCKTVLAETKAQLKQLSAEFQELNESQSEHDS